MEKNQINNNYCASSLEPSYPCEGVVAHTHPSSTASLFIVYVTPTPTPLLLYTCTCFTLYLTNATSAASISYVISLCLLCII